METTLASAWLIYFIHSVIMLSYNTGKNIKYELIYEMD